MSLARRAAVREQEGRTDTELEGKTAGMRVSRKFERRRRADVQDQNHGPMLEADIVRLRHGRWRRFGRGIVGNNGGQRIRFRAAHAVEARERAVPETHGLEEGDHAIDGFYERARRVASTRDVALAQRHEIEQDLDRNAGISADVAAVAQDLALELVAEEALHAPQLPIVAGNAKVGEHERGQGKEAIIARGRIPPGCRKELDLLAEAVRRRLVGAGGYAFEDKASMTDP